MSMNKPSPRSAEEAIRLKRPMSVAIYDEYADAARAVDYLAERQYPVETLAIVGTDLKSFERVTGNLSWGKVLVAGFVRGAMWAVMFVVFLWFLQPGVHPIGVFSLALVSFGIVGMFMAGIQYRLGGQQRDYTSTTGIIATHYEVLTEADNVDKARAMLGGGRLQQHSVPQPPPVIVQQSDLDRLPPPAFPGAEPAPDPRDVVGPPAPSGTDFGVPSARSGDTVGFSAQGSVPKGSDPHDAQGYGQPSSGQPTSAEPPAADQPYGQYWNSGDQAGIGDIPRRFSQGNDSAESPDGSPHRADSTGNGGEDRPTGS